MEITILDDKGVKRRLRSSNYQDAPKVKPYICVMPLKLEDGWNQVSMNLAELTMKAYGSNYAETLRVQVHANVRVRRIYFSERIFPEEELPPEFKLFAPVKK